MSNIKKQLFLIFDVKKVGKLTSLILTNITSLK